MRFFKLFKKSPYRLDDKLIVQDAFTFNGKKYLQCATATDLSAGRGISAMIIYEEFRMKCDKEYLELHIRATEKILSGGTGKIDLPLLAVINNNLKERINLVGMPDHVLKLASVYFWDESESPYYYDFDYNKKKIEEWKKNPEALAFFLSQPLKELMPFTQSQEMNAETYLKIAEMIGQMQEQKLQAILSSPE